MPASELTQEKLTSMVKEAFRTSDAELLRFEVKPATGKGEGFVGDVCAVDMTVKFGDEGGEERRLQWIVKTRSEQPLFPKEACRAMRMEEKETALYSTVR